MAKSKKKPAAKSSSPVRKTTSSKPAPQKKKQAPAPVKKTSTASKKSASKPPKKVAKAAPKKSVQKTGKKSAVKTKAKEVVKGKSKVAQPTKKQGKSAPVKGKSKTISASKSTSNKKVSAKGKGKSKEPEKKKRGRRKKNRGSGNYQKIKSFILRRHKRRTNVETDKQATNVAKAIYKYLKLERKIIDGKITQKVIKEALDFLYPQPQRKLGRLTIPEIPEWLQEPNPYYNIEQVNQAMADGAFRNIWIFSPMILGKRNNAYIYLSPTITYTYDETFKDWVDWINEEVARGTFQGGSPPEIFFRFKEVFRNSINNRWEVKLVSCDEVGNDFVTGYIPQGTRDVPQGNDNTEERFGVPLPTETPEGTVTSPITPPVQPPTTPPIQPPTLPPTVPTEPKELTEKKIKSEETREKGYKMENLIRAKNSIMDDLRFDKEMGFPLNPDLMQRLVEIRKQIDELTK